MNTNYDDRSFVLSGAKESDFFNIDCSDLITLREYLNMINENQKKLKLICSNEINTIINENEWIGDIKYESRPYYYNYIHNINMVAKAINKYNMGMEYDFSSVSDFFPLNYTYNFEDIERHRKIEDRIIKLSKYTDQLRNIYESGNELFKGFGDVKSVSNSFKIIGIDSVDILSSYYKLNHQNSIFKNIYKSNETIDESILDRIQLRLKK